MTRACLLLFAVVCAAGCRPPPEPPAPEPSPPDGRQTRLDEDGTKHVRFSPLGLIGFGETRDGDLPDADTFPGYELHGQAGVTLVVDARFEGCSLGLLALYGPQDEQGLWDIARAHDSGDRGLDLEYVLPAEGMYFVLMRCLAGDAVTYTLEVACEDCADASPCEQIEHCDLFCEDGFEVDDFDCRACACIEPPSCDDVQCDEGQRCEDGVCRDDPRDCIERCDPEVEPVCGNDFVTRPNACHAECAGVGHSPGACPDSECGPEKRCPEGQPCVDGQCCACDGDPSPVCGVDGREHLNECTARCAGVEVRHAGPCVERPCESADECQEGWECRPARRPGNDQACRERDADCVRECVPPPRTQPCSADERRCNDPRATCYIPPGSRRGACLFECIPDRPQCPDGAACAVVDGLEDAAGVCLQACEPDGPPTCEGELQCREDERGTAVCQPCNCPRDVPPEPVCADGHPFRTPCEAECAGHEEWAAGECDVDGCLERCADAPEALVCVGEDTLRNPCEARCQGHMRWMEGACEAPCGDDDPDCQHDECLQRCVGEMMVLVCGEGTIYASVCEAHCDDVELERLPGVCLEGVATACREEEDCAPTGCEESVCAAEPSRACPDYSPAAACFTRGACGCVMGQCQWRPDERTRECLQALHRPPPDDREGRE